MQELEYKFGDLTLKNPWMMAAKELGFLDPNEWSTFYTARAKNGVSGIVFPVREIEQQDISVVKSCLQELQDLQCISFLQIQPDITKLTMKLDLAISLGFSGILLQIESPMAMKDMLSLQEVILQYKNQLLVLVAIKNLDDASCKCIASIKSVMDGICILDVEQKLSILELAAFKKELMIPLLISVDIPNYKTLEVYLQNQACDAFLIWKPMLCDTKFVDKLMNGRSPVPCQNCGTCEEGLPVVCPYHPELGNEFFESLRRKIATRKEICIYGNGIDAGYAAQKALERGFPATICKTKNMTAFVPESDELLQYQTNLYKNLEVLGVKTEQIEGSLSDFLRERKPYCTVLFQKDLDDFMVTETMLDLLDERLSCVKFTEAQTKMEIEESLVAVYQFFKQFYLA